MVILLETLELKAAITHNTLIRKKVRNKFHLQNSVRPLSAPLGPSGDSSK
jgi:hypothetical protein